MFAVTLGAGVAWLLIVMTALRLLAYRFDNPLTRAVRFAVG